MHGSSWNVKVRMQLWIDCGCTVHVMALKTANGLEENPWYYQQQCEVSVKLGCSEHPENSQIVPVCFVIICLLTLFHLCILAEVLFLKRASLSVLLVYHCVDFFFWWCWTQDRTITSPKLQKNCHLWWMLLFCSRYFFSHPCTLPLYERLNCGSTGQLLGGHRWISAAGLVQCVRVTSLSVAFKIKEIRAAETQLYVCFRGDCYCVGQWEEVAF